MSPARSPLHVVAMALSLLLVAPLATSAQAWAPFGEEAGATCADGSAVHYLERAADPTRVVLYLEGGGGCWSADTCAFEGEGKNYTSQSLLTPEELAEREGVFDFADPRNPLAEHSWVYVPYCTGDLHLGDRTMAYSDEVVVEHRGMPNGLIAIDHLARAYPDAVEVIVAGTSAGAAPAPLYGALVAEALPEARVSTLADSAGAYPDDPALNGLLGFLWGAMEALPDWPELEGTTARDWGVPSLYGLAAARVPGITLAKFDYAYDDAQEENGRLAGVPADELLALIDEIDAGIEADGATVSSYVASGDAHTALDSEDLYELEVEGVRLLDWVTELVEGGAPLDVHCVDCR